jgi:hypothetical protein
MRIQTYIEVKVKVDYPQDAASTMAMQKASVKDVFKNIWP